MASILDRYGIKEVADVTFYELDGTGNPKNPVLYLDTLKVSTIEQTGEQAEARGGKGNPPLIIWDYGKEINVTLEDALFSAKSLAIMFGNGKVGQLSGDNKYIMKTEQFVYTTETKLPKEWYDAKGNKQKMINPKYYDEEGTLIAYYKTTGTGSEATSTLTHVKDEVKTTEGTTEVSRSFTADSKYFVTYDVQASTVNVIDISATSFPGTYYVTGDTYARNEANGEDEFFQFIIPKAKVQSENTITLEAEGDPSVFNMSLRVMRPADGKMMKLVKYSVNEGTEEDYVTEVIHNHNLSDDAETEDNNTTEVLG